MAVLAVQQIRRMRGGAQSQLMLGADGKLWVVKFQNNPQHLRVLANELMATRLAAAVGLTVPACDVVEVTEWLMANTAELLIELPERAAGAVPGGTAVWVAVCGRVDAGAGGGLSAGGAIGWRCGTWGSLPGCWCMDKWTCNANGRQAVFCEAARERKYTGDVYRSGILLQRG